MKLDSFSLCPYLTVSEVSDGAILKEVIFVLQGIEGKHIKYDSIRDAYIVDSKVLLIFFLIVSTYVLFQLFLTLIAQIVQIYR